MLKGLASDTTNGPNATIAHLPHNVHTSAMPSHLHPDPTEAPVAGPSRTSLTGTNPSRPSHPLRGHQTASPTTAPSALSSVVQPRPRRSTVRIQNNNLHKVAVVRDTQANMDSIHYLPTSLSKRQMDPSLKPKEGLFCLWTRTTPYTRGGRM